MKFNSINKQLNDMNIPELGFKYLELKNRTLVWSIIWMYQNDQ